MAEENGSKFPEHLTTSPEKIAGLILYLASDERHRVSMEDEIEWLETKLAEIKRLAEMLPFTPYESKKIKKAGVI